jgi:DNA-directed RNA polymerase specialized sigma24 family protein
MNATEINGVELEELVIEAANYDRQALITLLYSNWMTRLFERLARSAQRRYNVDGEEVRDHVFDQILSKSEPFVGPRLPWLSNPHNSSWSSCVAKWADTTAKNRSLNILAHRDVESRRAAAVEHEHTIRIENGDRIVAPSARTPSQEEELESKEQAGVEEKIDEKARQVFGSSTEECQRIASLWADGMTYQQIAAELDSSIGAVSRKLKKFQKAVLQELREGIVEEIGETKTEESGVDCVLAKIVKNREDLGDLLPKRAPATRTAPARAKSASEPGHDAPDPDGKRTRRRRRKTRSVARVV